MTERTFDQNLGPFYIESKLLYLGVAPVNDLVSLQTSDDVAVYPHAQFDVLDDGSLVRREGVISIWNRIIKPAIEEKIISDWNAAILLFRETEEGVSNAALIAGNPTEVERASNQIARVISRFKNGSF